MTSGDRQIESARSPVTYRKEIEYFIGSGWLDHVLSTESWWFDDNGRMHRVRRRNAHEAYLTVRSGLSRTLPGATIYRTLLLDDEFDLAGLSDGAQDFGQFWTSCHETAQDYIPRRRYQREHPMPSFGRTYVIEVPDIEADVVDWVGTVGCRLSNPFLDEVRLQPGTRLRAGRISLSMRGCEGEKIASTMEVAGVFPVPEGPGFLENFRMLNASQDHRDAA